MAKTCRKCGEAKDLNAFSKDRQKTDGLSSWCKPCASARNKKYNEKNKEKQAAQKKGYYIRNREKLLAKCAEYRAANREAVRNYQKQYYKEHREKVLARQREYQAEPEVKAAKAEYVKDWQKRNKDKTTARAKAWRDRNPGKQAEATKKWRINHPDYYNSKDHTARLLRDRIRKAVKHGYRAGSAVKDLGCSIEEFREYIAAQFQLGMTWGNWGEWHLDHIKPLASFDLSDRHQFLQACHYTNYQPLWAIENQRKGCAA